MLDRKYGKCLSSLWQIVGKKFLQMAIFLAILIFHYKMAIFWQYYWLHIAFIFFYNSYFFHTFKLFKFENQARNKLGTPEGAKSFLKGAQNFKLCPIALNHVQHIFPGGTKFFLGGASSPRLRACRQLRKDLFYGNQNALGEIYPLFSISVSQSGRNRPNRPKGAKERKKRRLIRGQNNTKWAKMLNH